MAKRGKHVRWRFSGKKNLILAVIGSIAARGQMNGGGFSMEEAPEKAHQIVGGIGDGMLLGGVIGAAVRAGRLQGFADLDVADLLGIVAVDLAQGIECLFLRRVGHDGEIPAALAVELVFDDVLDGLGHGGLI